MLRLVKGRDETVRQAARIIRKANREFDELAIPLGRDINELRERLQREAVASPEPKKTTRVRKTSNVLGLDDDEQAHYRNLLARRKRR